jgi:NDP-sugar pyrophosphorylase family protein
LALIKYAFDRRADELTLEPFEKMIANGHKMKVVKAKGQFLDGGTVEGWLYANKVVLGDV